MAGMNLPPVPPELKAMSAYLQRADELTQKEPIIAYWCTYYAAQVGISLKLKEPPARTFLFDLLAVLERMKKEIGPSDAIDDESASSAYVENFALKVFTMADNEDRRGNATRSTAKKFLAAANFLEILSVFQPISPDSSQSTAEKIKYAKWKAADIAKAFREGRKPTPGPPGGVAESQPEVPPQEPGRTEIESPPRSPPSIVRATQPPPPITDLPAPEQEHVLPGDLADPHTRPLSPGRWSTAATPGVQEGLRRAWVSDELEGRQEEEAYVDAAETERDGAHWVPPSVTVATASSSPESKKVHFSPSAAGTEAEEDGRGHQDWPSAPASASSHDLEMDQGYAPGINYAAAFVPTAPPLPPGTSAYEAGEESSYSHVSTAPPPPTSPPISPYYATSGPPPASHYQHEREHERHHVAAPPVPPPAVPVDAAATTIAVDPELPPATISRIQKHCRFAISALDYEDAETARKELRAALRMLGG